MSRLFNRRQKLLLAIVAGGKCKGCSARLSNDNFEADHVVPWSKGGKTVTKNGAALCRDCNRKKGNRI